ncbi:ATP-binding cassette domain-containing protein [Thiotrichales bacterium 19S11-10]|nr:ATP-binding cassette domain-containing protein [Thiotrichales bacterium 19S11-10]
MNKPIINCQNVILGYPQAHPLTKEFSLSIDAESWVGIVGENGSGKSTLLKTILGRTPPIKGAVRVFEHLAGDKKINRQVGYIPQSRHIDAPEKLSAYELLKATVNAYQFGIIRKNKNTKEKIDYFLELVGATRYANCAFQQLSGGQKKRIFLAQALINHPKLLLLDEPLADLDLQAKHHFIRCLEKVHQQIPITVLMISHEMNEMHQYLSNFIHFHNQDVILTPNYPFTKAFEDHCHHV